MWCRRQTTLPRGCPYHIFVFLMPMHHVSYFMALAGVGLWTINIHDRVTLKLPFVNGAAHHTIHHTGKGTSFHAPTTF